MPFSNLLLKDEKDLQTYFEVDVNILSFINFEYKITYLYAHGIFIWNFIAHLTRKKNTSKTSPNHQHEQLTQIYNFLHLTIILCKAWF